jgi:hypothetical protein
MSHLSFEEFKEYLLSNQLHKYMDCGISSESTSLEDDNINTTIPKKDTEYIQWAYENRQWIPKIGINRLKAFFFSLIYNPYDAEMVDITMEFQEPVDSSNSISLKYISTSFQDPPDFSETDFKDPNESSELIELLTLLMNNTYFQTNDQLPEANMEVD